MKQTLVFISTLLLLATVSFAAEEINLLLFNYNYGEITLLSTESLSGYYPTHFKEGETNIQIYSSQNQLLYERTIELPRKELTDSGNEFEMQGGPIIQQEFNFTLTVPRFFNEEKIILTSSQSQSTFYLNERETFSPKNSSFYFITLPIILLLVTIIWIVKQKIKKAE